MSFKTDYDSWPWNEHKEQAKDDAKFSHKNRDLYDHYDGEHKRAYAEEYDRETRKIEERKREEEERIERNRIEERRRYEEEEQRYYEEQEREQEEK